MDNRQINDKQRAYADHLNSLSLELRYEEILNTIERNMMSPLKISKLPYKLIYYIERYYSETDPLLVVEELYSYMTISNERDLEYLIVLKTLDVERKFVIRMAVEYLYTLYDHVLFFNYQSHFKDVIALEVKKHPNKYLDVILSGYNSYTLDELADIIGYKKSIN